MAVMDCRTTARKNRYKGRTAIATASRLATSSLCHLSSHRMSDAELSRPGSPGLTEGDSDVYKWNGLTLDEAPFGLEKIIDYEPGGHHPVHLGDGIGKDGRYRVIHKLGHGGFANVWMCRDLEHHTYKYVGLKIHMAEVSTDDRQETLVNRINKLGLDREAGGKYICLALDQFRIDGPNGSHLCYVYPVLGPRVSCILKEFENPDKTLRNIALQAVQGMATLHSHGICHGDFTPSNILLRTSGLDGLTEKQVIQVLGSPRQVKVLTQSGEIPTEPTAPKYLIHPVDFNKVASRFVTDQACIIDFGELFEISNPPEDLGIPQSYCSPELVLDKVAGIGSDLWALGCTIFEIRTGRKLFGMFDDDIDDHLYEIVLLLGKLPEPWWTTWEARRKHFEEEADPQGRAIFTTATRAVMDRMKVDRHGQPRFIREKRRSIQETLADGLWYLNDGIGDGIHRDIPRVEIEVFADLLYKILRYNPSGRLTANAAQDHEWFKL